MGAVASASHAAVQARIPYPYRATPSLLTASEAAFYRALEQAIGHRFVVFAKVRMLDLCAGLERRRSLTAFNHVAQKHVDFVLCDPESFRPALVVELDDRSHIARDRRRRDGLVDEVFRTMGVGLLRQWVSYSYDVSWIARRVDAALP